MAELKVIGASGYPSIDRIIRLGNQPQVGRTSAILNSDFYQATFGGCNVNICYILKKLGVQAIPFMNVGDDFESSGYEKFLQQEKLPLVGIKRVTGVNCSATLLLEDENHQHITLFYEGAMGKDYAVFDNSEAAGQIDLGIITVGNLQYNLDFLEILVQKGKEVAFSMKYDPNAFPKDKLKLFLNASSYLFMNETEAGSICELYGYSSIEHLFKNEKCKCIVVTKGSQGSKLSFRQGGRICSKTVKIAKARRIIDHVGVGDGFVAGFLFGLTRGVSYEKCAQMGSVVASFILEEKGCLDGAPTLEQVIERQKERY